MGTSKVKLKDTRKDKHNDTKAGSLGGVRL
jgi:hypothetical protein